MSEVRLESAINDTTVEVEFGKAIDEDFITEAEKDGDFFRVFKEGDNVTSDKAVKSESINFSKDGKTATFTLGKELGDGSTADKLVDGKKYTVALMNGGSVASEKLHEIGPTVLRAAASAPDFDVSAVSDKIIVNYGEKMKSTALTVENYTVYDDKGNELGALSDYVDGDGDWTNASEKTSVEFKLDGNIKNLKAGKTYKLHVDEAVETDDNKSLTDSDRTITVKTPSVDEAKPKAVTSRVVDANDLRVVFDKDIANANVNASQIDIKTSTGKTINADSVDIKNGNELQINAASDDLDPELTYEVSLPANAVSNTVFLNATSDAVSNLKAKAQEDVEIKSVNAELKVDAKDKTQADLHLEFDQRPNLSSLISSDVKIKDGDQTYALSNLTNAKYTGDKTIVIENVESSFSNFEVEKGTTYDFEIASGGIKTDAFGSTDGKANQSKLETTFGGLSISAPEVDEVTLVSGNEIKVDFKEDISSVNSDDVVVNGFEKRSNGKVDSDVDITADDLTTSVSGSTLTLKTKDDFVFNTAATDTKITIAKESFTSKDNNIANDAKVEVDGSSAGDETYVDYAGPVMVGVKASSNLTDNEYKHMEVTFTENVDKKGANEDIAKLFSVKNAAKDSVGTIVGTVDDTSETFAIKFDKAVFDEDTVMSRIETEYAGGNTYYIKDTQGNKAQDAVIKGVDGNNPAKQ